MAVGAAGTFNDANVRPQNDDDVSPKQADQFKEAVRSNTPDDASGTQSSKGKDASAHLQNTSNAFALHSCDPTADQLWQPDRQAGRSAVPIANATEYFDCAKRLPAERKEPCQAGRPWHPISKVVGDLGARIANSQGPVTDADRAEWMQAQQELQQSITDYAGEISHTASGIRPIARGSHGRNDAASATSLRPRSCRCLHVSIRDLGRAGTIFTTRNRDPREQALQTRMKIYGITDEQMQRYIATGQELDGLKKAFNEARRSGDWPALGVVRASYQMRADYLLAQRPVPMMRQAASRRINLDAASASLTNNRSAIHMNWGSEKYSKLSKKYPDATTRPANVQKQMDEAKQAIASCAPVPSIRSRLIPNATAKTARRARSPVMRLRPKRGSRNPKRTRRWRARQRRTSKPQRTLTRH